VVRRFLGLAGNVEASVFVCVDGGRFKYSIDYARNLVQDIPCHCKISSLQFFLWKIVTMNNCVHERLESYKVDADVYAAIYCK